MHVLGVQGQNHQVWSAACSRVASQLAPSGTNLAPRNLGDRFTMSKDGQYLGLFENMLRHQWFLIFPKRNDYRMGIKSLPFSIIPRNHIVDHIHPMISPVKISQWFCSHLKQPQLIRDSLPHRGATSLAWSCTWPSATYGFAPPFWWVWNRVQSQCSGSCFNIHRFGSG